jgi:hypothetical protein
MRAKKENKLGGKWSRVKHGIATYQYFIGDKDVAAIFPKETRDGKIAWGFFIKRIGKARSINEDNLSVGTITLSPHYMKKRDVKSAIESAVEVLVCQ